MSRPDMNSLKDIYYFIKLLNQKINGTCNISVSIHSYKFEPLKVRFVCVWSHEQRYYFDMCIKSFEEYPERHLIEYISDIFNRAYKFGWKNETPYIKVGD